MRLRHVLSFTLLSLSACPKDEAPAAGARDGGAATTSAASAATAAAVAPAPCTIEGAPTLVAKGVRLDSGLTLTHLPDGRVALGYALFDGTPHAAVINREGKTQPVE